MKIMPLSLAFILIELVALISVAAFVPSLRFSSRRHHIHELTVVRASIKRQRGSSKGFGNKESKTEEPQTTDKSIYSLPALYDLAFGYRSYEDEVDFLLDAHKQHSTSSGPPTRVLELAAGPARHSLTALILPDSSVESVTAVDLSPEMMQYATELANAELSSGTTRFV